MTNLSTTKDILFTCQEHDAKRAGKHLDVRLVSRDIAYSWSTKKDLPNEGQSIILHEQPPHTREYALSKKVVIPDGQYGAGETRLLYAKKGQIEAKEKHFIITVGKDKYLLKHVPQYDSKMWLFKNLGQKNLPNKYLEKIKNK